MFGKNKTHNLEENSGVVVDTVSRSESEPAAAQTAPAAGQPPVEPVKPPPPPALALCLAIEQLIDSCGVPTEE